MLRALYHRVVRWVSGGMHRSESLCSGPAASPGDMVHPKPPSTGVALAASGVGESDFVEPTSACSTACPYCQNTLEVRPTRTRKCPACKCTIVVRASRTGGAKLLLTEEQAAEFDRVRQAQARLNTAIRHAANAGFDRAEFERRSREMAARTGAQSAPRDVFWSLAEEAACAAQRNQQWERLRTVRQVQATVVYLEGGAYMPLLREASRAELLSYREQGFGRVRILSSGDERVCDACKAHDGKRMSIAEALGSLPIPNDCANEEEWCRCVWTVGR